MLYSDRPIQKAYEDTLNRRGFAQDLAAVIAQYDSSESLSIGLYGPWGSGKTSVINMIVEAVESTSDDIVILRFNPWLCSDSKQLISQFFRQLSSKIKLKKKISEAVWKKIDDYSDLFELTGALGTVGLVLSPFAGLLTNRAKLKRTKSEQDLQKKKNEITDYLSKEKVKILVTIDDIDRLSENEIIAIFQLVKSLADFPNTIYLLAFDYEVVVKALSKVQCGEGEKYLEKIIQVPFALPKANTESIEDILFSKLDKVIAGLPKERWDKENWVLLYQTGIKAYIHSIRDALRYSNVFMLKYSLLEHEVDVVDLLGLTCLQVFEPAIYEQLPLCKEQLCGGIPLYSGHSRNMELERVKETRERLLALANAKTKEAAKNILERLFPKLCEISGWGISRTYDHSLFLIRHNVAEPESFSRYFALALAPGDLSSETIENWIFNTDRTEAELELQRIEQEGKIEKLLDELQAYGRQGNTKWISTERAEILISSFARQCDKFTPKESMSFFSTPFAWKLLFCIRPLLEILDSEERFSTIKELFLDEKVSTYAIWLLLSDFEREHNRFVEESKEHQSILIPLEQVLMLEKLFVERVCAELEQNVLLQTKGAAQVLNLFEKIAPELAEEKTKGMISDDLSVAKLIHHCTGHGRMAVQIVYKTWDVSLEVISHYIDLEEAKERMERFVKQKEFQILPREEQENVVAFLITMEHKGEEKDRAFDSISEDTIQRRLNEIRGSNQT